MMRNLTPVDKWLLNLDEAIRSTTGNLPASDENRSWQNDDQPTLSTQQKRLSSRLMRVNHCGEVCAQALYSGQSITSKSLATRNHMIAAAEDERKHLIWCQNRLTELDSHVSYLNPVWFATSFLTGMVTGLMGDSINLGFVAATEEEVCKHLDKHIELLPNQDRRSREILGAMRDDEQRHHQDALSLGGLRYPSPIRRIMTAISGLMTKTTYWL
jgi:ubiquinone biosynthesis monooxygenase Coq7